MFDISMSELMLVGIVGLYALGPKELFAAIKSVRSLVANLKAYYEEFMNHLSKELEGDDYVKIIFDDEGRPQKVYDLEKIKPYLKDEEAENDIK